MAPKQKKPAIAVSLSNPRREPRVAADAENSAAKHPIWCLAQMDLEGPWPWEIDALKLREIHTKLCQFEKMTWGAIAGNRHHFLSVESVCKKAKDRLVELKLDDAADLCSHWPSRTLSGSSGYGQVESFGFYGGIRSTRYALQPRSTPESGALPGNTPRRPRAARELGRNGVHSGKAGAVGPREGRSPFRDAKQVSGAARS